MSGLSACQRIPGKQKVIDRQWKVFRIQIRIQEGKNGHKKEKRTSGFLGHVDCLLWWFYKFFSRNFFLDFFPVVSTVQMFVKLGHVSKEMIFILGWTGEAFCQLPRKVWPDPAGHGAAGHPGHPRQVRHQVHAAPHRQVPHRFRPQQQRRPRVSAQRRHLERQCQVLNSRLFKQS